jgi:hypothetical protein
MALIAVVAVMQAVELVARVRHTRGNRVRQLGHEFLGTWRTIFVPLGTYGASVVLFQLLLPTALLPDNGNTLIHRRSLGGLPEDPEPTRRSRHASAVGAVILLIALAGVVVGVRKRTFLDLPLGLLALFSAMIIGTHFRTVDRYWLQVTPWVLYFAAVAVDGCELGVRPAPRDRLVARCHPTAVPRRGARRRAGRRVSAPAISTTQGAPRSGPPTRRLHRSTRRSSTTRHPMR